MRTTTTDGRHSRWDGHREQRRRELVEATLRAIRRSGASVGMEEIAAEAGTSKTVFYRHFQDRSGLYHAVTEHVDQLIMRDVTAAVRPGLDRTQAWLGSPQDFLAAAIEAYLRLVEDDPEIYRFVMAAPLLSARERGTSEVAAGLTQQIGHQIGDLFSAALRHLDQDPSPAELWGHAVVGLVRAAADQWLAAGASASGTSRAEVTRQLTDLVWGGVSSAWRTSPAR